MSNKDILNIGVICLDAGNAGTITDHITALTGGSRHHSHILSVWPDNMLRFIDFDLFDVLIIHYTLVARDFTYLTPALRKQVTGCKGLKVAFIQDEYRFVDETVNALKELDVRLLFSCVPEPEIAKVYSPEMLPGMKAINVLTGYVPEKLLQQEVPLYEHRAIDVGYRSRKVPMWLGNLGWEKYQIAVKFSESAARYRLRVDISCREEDRIYGEDWIRFTSSCKSFLGVESGASVFDFTGDIQHQVEAHEARDPDVTFEELQRLYFSEHEGKICLNQISPRCFESAALRTLQVLYEGGYSGILTPWRHFVPLKKDHSNLDEISAVIHNPQRAKPIIAAAYTEIACNPEYGYAAFSKKVDLAIEATILPEQVRHCDPSWVTQEIAKCLRKAKRRTNYTPTPTPISIHETGVWAWGWGCLKRFLLLVCNKWRAIAVAPVRNKWRAIAATPWRSVVLRKLDAIAVAPVRNKWRAIAATPWRSVVLRKLGAIAVPDSYLLLAKRRSEDSESGRWESFYYQVILLGLSSWASPLIATRANVSHSPTVVFLHTSYYHFPLLARELRSRGWNAWSVTLGDPEDNDTLFSHEADLSIYRSNREIQDVIIDRLLFELKRKCDIVYFSGVGMMRLSQGHADLGALQPQIPFEFMSLKDAGVRIGYSSVGCNDGISQSNWHEWTGGMCNHCRYQTEPAVCSDIRNLAWGHQISMICDVIASELLPPLDYLANDSVLHVPFAFCVDEEELSPGLDIPDRLRFESNSSEVTVLHGMGNFARRTAGNADPKGTRHVIEAIESLRAEGLPIRLYFVDKVPTGDMKYVQAQADIVVDQLYFGRYGAMARECMMLGKPVVGFLKINREEESGDTLACLDECPIVNASPETLKEVLRDLVLSPDKRAELGLRSRKFALKWHSTTAAGDQFEKVWREGYQISTDEGVQYVT